MKLNKKLPHYWLCAQCAEEKGGVMEDDRGITVCAGDCPYCGDKNVALIPWVDYNWPKDRDLNTRAKTNRD